MTKPIFIQNPNAPTHHKITVKALIQELEVEASKGCGGHDVIFDNKMTDLIKLTHFKLSQRNDVSEYDLKAFSDEAIKRGFISPVTEEDIAEEKRLLEQQKQNPFIPSPDYPDCPF